MDESQAPPFSERVFSAFSIQYNLILLAGAVSFAAASGSLLPLIVGAMAEIVWLSLGALPLIHRKIAERRAVMPGVGLAAPYATELRGLQAEYVSRFERLARVYDQVHGAPLDMTGVSPAELESTLDKLEQGKRSFLRLAAIHQRVSRFLHAMPAAELERETVRIGEAISAEKDLAVRMALRQSLMLAQRRLRQREQMVSTRRTVELQMATMEQSFLYLESVVLGGASALEVTEEVDAFTVRISTVAGLEAEASRGLTIGGASSQEYSVPIVLDSD